ncbi:MAG: hypothetical protein EOO05_00950 [Chitinophagaceae bacterium]|nr:MAG: hypothetical protein EOO05_00950 [Chitinophagaceae bacterium]
MENEEAIRSAARQLDIVLVNDHAEWMQQLQISINQLLVHDFNKLIAILYRLDVSEPKLRQRLAEANAADAAAVIAGLVIERQVEKIKSRRESRRDDINTISEDDRW